MLTTQKRKFALALMSGKNKTASAIAAGYSAKTARVKGSQLAKDLEKKGLYRRAAERWAKVMVQLSDDQKRKVAAQKRAECLRKARRTPVSPVNLTEIKQAVNRLHSELGMGFEERRVFRRYKGTGEQNTSGNARSKKC
ncbi:transcriptional regulator PchABC-homolog [Escherichia coli]|nr:transcriptional regulator PchABC-homolog [Escherichia coli]